VVALTEVVRGEFHAPAQPPIGPAASGAEDLMPFLLVFVFLVFMLGRVSRPLGTAAGGFFMPFLVRWPLPGAMGAARPGRPRFGRRLCAGFDCRRFLVQEAARSRRGGPAGFRSAFRAGAAGFPPVAGLLGRRRRVCGGGASGSW